MQETNEAVMATGGPRRKVSAFWYAPGLLLLLAALALAGGGIFVLVSGFASEQAELINPQAQPFTGHWHMQFKVTTAYGHGNCTEPTHHHKLNPPYGDSLTVTVLRQETGENIAVKYTRDGDDNSGVQRWEFTTPAGGPYLLTTAGDTLTRRYWLRGDNGPLPMFGIWGIAGAFMLGQFGIMLVLATLVARLMASRPVRAGMVMAESAPPLGADVNISKRERDLAMFCHLAQCLGLILPFAGIGVSLYLWYRNHEQSAFIDDQGREALNFQINLMVAGLITMFLCLICIGFLLAQVLYVAALAMPIIAATRAAAGERYRYPLIYRPLR